MPRNDLRNFDSLEENMAATTKENKSTNRHTPTKEKASSDDGSTTNEYIRQALQLLADRASWHITKGSTSVVVKKI